MFANFIERIRLYINARGKGWKKIFLRIKYAQKKSRTHNMNVEKKKTKYVLRGSER